MRSSSWSTAVWLITPIHRLSTLPSHVPVFLATSSEHTPHTLSVLVSAWGEVQNKTNYKQASETNKQNKRIVRATQNSNGNEQNECSQATGH